MGLKKNDRPVTDEDDTLIRDLHAQGFGRNEIARRTGRSGRTVSVIAARLGLTFDRTQTAVATEARKTDAKARRVALLERYYDHAHKALDRLDRPEHTVREVSFGKVVTYTIEEVTAQDYRALMQASTSAATQAAKLEALDNNGGVDSAKSLVGELAAGLTAAYNAMNEGAGDAP
ncbi:helix-turn-helix domain-containing protein [Streptomyces purpureus]|uniref:helix-turn-helix domain-containing protein n=1 Tax=Streptomyces purpureus TaxID=1951 RepID=UPI003799FD76